ncbi:DinB family protein [Paenibacillus qinlingensis]|uniref:DinB family protein n=1 Tax=Paenibacillus qinlingensis TaxID=1837343 RepID=UPI001565D51D|nr:DinB family protein [Paenibacillus qinlingensis]NQX62494.1 DinB family protein [Paenibacillus qinlingensis]
MEPNGRARLLLSVSNLEKSITFYRSQLGWELLEQDEGGRAALLHIGDTADEAVLVVEGCEPNEVLNRWLRPNYSKAQAGSLVYIGVTSVIDVESNLLARGFQQDIASKDAEHIRERHVPTMDGYTLVYWEELFPTHIEIMEMYEAGVAELQQAIDGLSDAQLNLREVHDKWSIREHVLHLIDLELITIHKVKFALAEPGRMYVGNSFQPDDWHRGLHYAQRPIAAEVLLFGAVRQHILGLCKHLPDALDRTIRTTNREETVAQLLKMMAGHAKHHMRAARRIRELHGVSG